MFSGDIALVNEYTGGVDSASAGAELCAHVGSATAVILANNGVLIIGETIEQAAYRAVAFERTCRLHFDSLSTGRKLVPVPMKARVLLKQSLNTLSVDNYWRGEIRSLHDRSPEVLEDVTRTFGAIRADSEADES